MKIKPDTHWNQIYMDVRPKELGWYEEYPLNSLMLIEECKLKPESIILIAGAGASTLVDELLNIGYENIYANDISSRALENLVERTGEDSRVQLIVDDLLNPSLLNSLNKVDLWHDRAVLHFFTEAEDRVRYFNLLRKLLKHGGWVIIAAFSMAGADKCSGLPVYKYNEELLKENLGPEFVLKRSFNYTHTMPSGSTRDYVYTLFQRVRLRA